MGEDACSVAVQFSAALLFSSSERGLMALGINGEVISRAYALGPARGGWGLCATACTPTWVFVRAHVPVRMRVRVCLPSEATHNRRAWLTAKNPERSKHSGKQMHSGTIRTPCVDTALPAALLRDVSLLARRQSANNQTKKEQNYWFSAAFVSPPRLFDFLTCSVFSSYVASWRYMCGEFILVPTNPEKVNRLLFPPVQTEQAQRFPPRWTPHAFKTVRIAAWCNAAACTSKAEGCTARRAGSNTVGK